MSELSRFVYVKSRVTLHVKSNAEKVNCWEGLGRKNNREVKPAYVSCARAQVKCYLANNKF